MNTPVGAGAINSRPKAKEKDIHTASGLSQIWILALNVCGLKSRLNTPEFKELCASYDILCFSETKCDDIDMPIVEEVFNSWC